MPEITGTSGANNLSGTSTDDTIKGSGGSDTLAGGDGNDVIYGGYGGTLNLGTVTYSFGGLSISDDTVTNTLNVPNTVGSGGSFWVIVQDGGFTKAIRLQVQDLGNGDFSLQAVEAKYDANSLYSTLNGDFTAIQTHFNASGNPQTLADTVTGGGYGIHSISADGASNGTSYLSVGSATSFTRNPDGADTISGGAGDDTIFGEDGNDTIQSGPGNDVIDGGTGDDEVYGGAGNDTIDGGDGNDWLQGGAGTAGSGDDSIDGGAGNDTIFGEDGNDTLDGGTGNDRVNGGGGNDQLTGGDGNDRFELIDANSSLGATGHDTITDFNAGNTGTLDDGDQSNNDFVDLSAYYNATNLAAWNAANPGQQYANPLAWMRADQADDGILNAAEAGWNATTSLTIQNGGTAVVGSDLTFDNTNVVCFNRGTLIDTENGPVLIENLKPGDMVRTMDHGYQPLRLALKRKVPQHALIENDKLRPVRISASALGNNLPETDLLISRQHRMMVSSPICKRMFGDESVLVAGVRLTELPGIYIDYDVCEVEYYHLVFDQHEIVIANGAYSESFFPGPEALKALTAEALEEITTLFPVLKSGLIPFALAAHSPDGKKQKRLIKRHLDNNKPMQTSVNRCVLQTF